MVCCLNPQKLGSVTLAFQVYVVLHCFLPRFEEISIENSILNTAKIEANSNRPPEKSPHAPPARSRVGKTFNNVTLVYMYGISTASARSGNSYLNVLFTVLISI